MYSTVFSVAQTDARMGAIRHFFPVLLLAIFNLSTVQKGILPGLLSVNVRRPPLVAEGGLLPF